jgi:hypothetical protein
MTTRKKNRDDIRQSFDKLADDVLIDDLQLALVSGCAPSTVKRWRREDREKDKSRDKSRDKLPQVILINGRPRYRVGDVRALLRGQALAAETAMDGGHEIKGVAS